MGNRSGHESDCPAADGETIKEVQLDSLPTPDGIAAAQGCLFVATEDGKVVCLRGE